MFKFILNLKILRVLGVLIGLCWLFNLYRKRDSLNRFNKVIVFGDSFSSTGNSEQELHQPYSTVTHRYQGRYCDGLIWIERLNVHEKQTYAYPGATTDNNFLPAVKQIQGVLVPSVRQQITTYLTHAQQNNLDITQPLYIIWIGFNDYYRHRSIQPKQIVDSIMNAMKDLLVVGAKNFLVFNKPPLQAFPCYRYNNREIFYTEITSLFNIEFSQKLDLLQKNHPNASIHMFDLHSLLTNIISNRTSKKFLNTIDPCWNTSNPMSLDQHCPNPQKYVFVDIVHLTSTVHQLIADAIQPFLSIYFKKNHSNSYIYSF